MAVTPQQFNATNALEDTLSMKVGSSSATIALQEKQMQLVGECVMLHKCALTAMQVTIVVQMRPVVPSVLSAERKISRAAQAVSHATKASTWMCQAHLQPVVSHAASAKYKRRLLRMHVTRAQQGGTMQMLAATLLPRIRRLRSANHVSLAHIRTSKHRQAVNRAPILGLASWRRMRAQRYACNVKRASTQKMRPIAENALVVLSQTRIEMAVSLVLLAMPQPIDEGVRLVMHVAVLRTMARMDPARSVRQENTSQLVVYMSRTIVQIVLPTSTAHQVRAGARHVQVDSMASPVAHAVPAPRVTRVLQAPARVAPADKLQPARVCPAARHARVVNKLHPTLVKIALRGMLGLQARARAALLDKQQPAQG